MGPGAADDQELQVIQRRPRSVDPETDMSGSLDGQRGWVPARKRRLAGIVAVAIVGCAGILVAAGVAHMSRSKAAGMTTASAAVAAPSGVSGPPAAEVTSASPPAPVSAAAAATAPATGNLVLVRPAVRGYVWLDGQKITTTSAIVSCGAHKIKVGSWGHPHSVTVPCGGDLKVWR